MAALRPPSLGRSWPVAAMLALFALFLLVHGMLWTPLRKRYDTALTRAGSLGAVLDLTHGGVPAAMPPRVYALLMENSGTATEVDNRAQAGTLAADAVQRLPSLASQAGLDVVVAEPGAVTQQPGWNQVRAHVRMHGSWGEALAFLDLLARGGGLYTIERLAVTPTAATGCDVEVWATRTTLKRRRAGS